MNDEDFYNNIHNYLKEWEDFKDLALTHKKLNDLQTRWNSLRECIIGVIDGAGEELNTIRQGDDLEYINKCTLQYEAIRKNLEIVLDKMNELEGEDK